MTPSRTKAPDSNRGNAIERGGPSARRKGFGPARRPSTTHRVSPPEPVALRIGECEDHPARSWLDASSATLARVKPAQGSVGPYRLVCELAAGGMATVYLGVKGGIGGFEKLVAIKKIHSSLTHIPDF